MMKKITIILFLIVVAVFATACTQRFNGLQRTADSATSTADDEVQPGEVAVIDSNIIVTTPLSNDKITSPLEVSGRSSLTDGILYVRLMDLDNRVIASSTVQALGGTQNWGYYSSKLEFEPPFTESGWLEVYSLREKETTPQDLIRLPVNFEDFKRPTVLVYFGNSQTDPENKECAKVYPVERTVTATPSQLPLAALSELFTGPTEADVAKGFITSIKSQGLKIQRLESKDKKVYIDFNDVFEKDVTDKCTLMRDRAQVIATLSPFVDNQEIIISVNGQPLKPIR